VNVAAHGPVIAFVLNHLGAVPPLEEVPRSPPTPAGPDRIAGEEALHSHAEVGARRLDHEIEMVTHHDIAQQLPAMAHNSVFESVKQPTSVRIIADDLLPGIAPCHHVINGTLELDP
jgi:hypothetical protein